MVRADIEIVEVSSDNLAQHPQAICFINPKHALYGRKVEWLEEQFGYGLKIKLLYLEGEKRPVGYWRRPTAGLLKDLIRLTCGKPKCSLKNSRAIRNSRVERDNPS